VLTDRRVSWWHAELRVEGNTWVLADLDSTNGSFLGMRRSGRIEISADSVIRLGDAQDGPVLRCAPRLPTMLARVAPPSWDGPRGTGLTEARELRVDSSPTAMVALPVARMSIGRTPDNDLVLSDLEVSRHHAELRKLATGGYEIVDLDSHNGIYVNGSRVQSHALTESDLVGIGRSTFRLRDGHLRQYVDEGEITITAHELFVQVPSGKVLLDHVTFPVPEKCLLGIIGPSGAGKSTLLGALTGTHPADTGSVRYDNRDLYQNYSELRYRIGLVPQENILHTQLTARRVLQYSAELRFPADTKVAERTARVDEVLAELGLTRHADTRADRLSGGQLKRVNVAQELLTKPSLLLLDEPTSRLDPGLDKAIMQQLRDLAHEARTVVVVTHSMANLDTCHRLLVLAPGGKVAFYGPPIEALRYFGLPGWAEVFQAFERYPDREWGAEFTASPAYTEWGTVAAAQETAESARADAPAAARGGAAAAPGQAPADGHADPAVREGDRGRPRLCAVHGAAPARPGPARPLRAGQGGLGRRARHQPDREGAAADHGHLRLPGRDGELGPRAGQGACHLHQGTGGRTVLRRLPGLQAGRPRRDQHRAVGRDRPARAGRPPAARPRRVPDQPAAARTADRDRAAIPGLDGAGPAGLRHRETSEKTMPFLVMATMAQIVLSGGVVPLSGLAGLAQLSWIAPARWGFSAAASTVNLNTLARGSSDPLWRQSPGNWLRDIGIMAVLATAFLLVAWIRLHRLGPRRRR
jgi:ABC transport system ATP-binding/permease protein